MIKYIGSQNRYRVYSTYLMRYNFTKINKEREAT